MHNNHKELILKKNGEFLFQEKFKEYGPIKKDEVRVKPLNVGVCSSDIPRCFDEKAYFYPLIIGHEFLVSVLEDPTNEFLKGQRCAVFPLKPCFKCEGCLVKQYNKCSCYSYYGSRTSGGMQSCLDIKKWNLIPLPNEIDDISGGLIEPLAVCLHASKFVEKKQKVLLYGGGFLSQILSQILENNGSNICTVDRNEYKKEFFSSKVEFNLNSKNIKDSSFDYTIECCGADNVLEECVRLTKPNGKIIQLANPNYDLKIKAKVLSSFMRKEQLLIGSWNSLYRPDNPEECDWGKSIQMIINKEIDISKLISHTSNLEQSDKLLKQIFKRRKDKNILPKFNKALIKIK